MKAVMFGLGLGAAATLAAGPAHAQFMTNYPIIIVPPPQSQTVIMPKQRAGPAPRPDTTPPPQPTRPPEGAERYQGRTLIR